MVRTYVRKADSRRAPKEELALLSNEARIERRKLKSGLIAGKPNRRLPKKQPSPPSI